MAIQAKPAEIRLMNRDDLMSYLKEQQVEFEASAPRSALEKMALDNLTAAKKESADERKQNDAEQAKKPDAVKKIEKEVEKEKEADATEDFYAMDLPDLLQVLTKRGFRTKEELAGMITGFDREKKNMAFAHAELAKREEQLVMDEVKLKRRIADAEKEFLRLTTAKEELRAILGQYETAKKEFALHSSK